MTRIPLGTLARRAVGHETRELLQCLGGPDLRAAQAAELERVPARCLEGWIGERSRLVQRSAVAVVALVEAVLGDKLLENQGFTRHG